MVAVQSKSDLGEVRLLRSKVQDPPRNRPPIRYPGVGFVGRDTAACAVVKRPNTVVLRFTSGATARKSARGLMRRESAMRTTWALRFSGLCFMVGGAGLVALFM